MRKIHFSLGRDKAYCNLDYAALSLIDLVTDVEVRSLLQEARAFASGEKAGALTSLRIALHKIENPTGKRLPLLKAPAKPRMPNEMARAGWDQYLNQLHSFLEQSAARMNAAMLSVDPIRYAVFLRSTPTVQWIMSGKYSVIMMRSYDDVPEEHFAESLDFLIDYALKAEEAYIPVPLVPSAQREGYLHATQQAFREAHELAFAYFGGVFRKLRYDNLTSAVKKILRGHRREETARFVAFRLHWRFEAEFCTPAEPHDKGGIEGEAGYFRRNRWVPVPEAAIVAERNRQIITACQQDEGRLLAGRPQTVGAYSVRNHARFL